MKNVKKYKNLYMIDLNIKKINSIKLSLVFFLAMLISGCGKSLPDCGNNDVRKLLLSLISDQVTGKEDSEDPYLISGEYVTLTTLSTSDVLNKCEATIKYEFQDGKDSNKVYKTTIKSFFDVKKNEVQKSFYISANNQDIDQLAEHYRVYKNNKKELNRIKKMNELGYTEISEWVKKYKESMKYPDLEMYLKSKGFVLDDDNCGVSPDGSYYHGCHYNFSKNNRTIQVNTTNKRINPDHIFHNIDYKLTEDDLK